MISSYKKYLSGTVILLFAFCSGQVIGQNGSSNLAGPQTYRFISPSYVNAYDSRIPTVLTIRPGDTVHTETIDAGGFDKNGERKGKRGNPLTGPFYVDGAKAGDVLAIEIIHLRLNRASATTLNAFIPDILPSPQDMRLWKNAKRTTWLLDTVKMMASPPDSFPHLAKFKVPLSPFLGSIGVAPPGTKSVHSGGFGEWGGNMDYKRITEGATLYLPIYHDGAILFMGDGHALQGDGELNGDALETSLNLSFTVSLVRPGAQKFPYPRIEDANSIMAFGQSKNLEQATKEAIRHLMHWLQHDYDLSVEEVTQVIGSAVTFQIPKLVPKIAEVVAIMPKNLLQQIGKGKMSEAK
ncbi:MAG: acetamidase/formamidase family protein [Chitinophagaceae bacterium]